MAIYAIFNVATQNRKLVDARMRGFYVEKVYLMPVMPTMIPLHITLIKCMGTACNAF